MWKDKWAALLCGCALSRGRAPGGCVRRGERAPVERAGSEAVLCFSHTSSVLLASVWRPNDFPCLLAR